MSGDGRVERAIKHLDVCLGEAAEDERDHGMTRLVGVVIAWLRRDKPELADIMFLLGLEHSKHLGVRMRAEHLVDENRLLTAENTALRAERERARTAADETRGDLGTCPACSGPLVITEVGPYCPTCAEAEQVGGAP